jgi:hypothetical protein
VYVLYMISSRAPHDKQVYALLHMTYMSKHMTLTDRSVHVKRTVDRSGHRLIQQYQHVWQQQHSILAIKHCLKKLQNDWYVYHLHHVSVNINVRNIDKRQLSKIS